MNFNDLTISELQSLIDTHSNSIQFLWWQYEWAKDEGFVQGVREVKHMLRTAETFQKIAKKELAERHNEVRLNRQAKKSKYKYFPETMANDPPVKTSHTETINIQALTPAEHVKVHCIVTNNENFTDAVIQNKGIGDINGTAPGTGARYNSGKPDFSLIPLTLLEGEARVWMKGAEKYSRNNWMRGMAWSVPFASLLRHLTAWQTGEDFDKETGEHHLDHASCNIRMLRMYHDSYKEGDDRPKQFFSKKT